MGIINLLQLVQDACNLEGSGSDNFSTEGFVADWGAQQLKPSGVSSWDGCQ
jgi:hypothetical protein